MRHFSIWILFIVSVSSSWFPSALSLHVVGAPKAVPQNLLLNTAYRLDKANNAAYSAMLGAAEYTYEELTFPMKPDLATKIADNMKSFLDSMKTQRVVLVTLGDSTMSGLSTRLYEALAPRIGVYDLWMFNQCEVWGSECKKWSEAPPFYNVSGYDDVFSSIKDAGAILEKDGCSLGGSNFMVHAYASGRLIHYSWGFNAESFGTCWNECLTRALQALQASAVVINQGLHLLHAYPRRSCHKTAAERVVSYIDCGRHDNLVSSILTDLQPVVPITLWKTSNWVCDEKFYGGWRSSLDKWHDPKQAIRLEKRCEADCTAFSSERRCQDEVIDGRSSKLQRKAVLQAIRNVKQQQSFSKKAHEVGFVDAFSITEDQCYYTTDGRHYGKLDPDITVEMTSELARLAHKISTSS